MKIKIVLTAVVLVTALVVGADELIRSKNTNQQVTEETLQVFKSPTCGCCGSWIEHAEENNFSVDVRHPADLNGVKEKYGINPRYQSCHTAVHSSGYVFEGHIPAEVMTRFLDQPVKEAIGLAVPGMPLGSPGMEYGSRVDPYSVRLLMKDGSVRNYASVSAQGIEYHL